MQIESFVLEATGRLARIEEKLDVVLSRTTDHEARVRSLEGSKARWAGIVTGISVVLSAITTLLTGVWTHHGR